MFLISLVHLVCCSVLAGLTISSLVGLARKLSFHFKGLRFPVLRASINMELELELAQVKLHGSYDFN